MYDKISHNMEIMTSAYRFTSGWTFDSLVNSNVIGSIREPLLIRTASGIDMVPSSIMYKQNESGSRVSPRFPGSFQKEVNEYARGALSEGQNPEEKYLIYDEESGLHVIGLPFTQDSLVFSSLAMFKDVVRLDSPESAFLRSLQSYFPQAQFGLFGSWALGMNTPDSDIDLVVYNGKTFEQFFQDLQSQEVQQALNILPSSEEQLQEYSVRYANQFRISISEAEYLAKLRTRFIVELENGSNLKIGFSSTFTPDDYGNFETILGAKKMGKIETEGIAVETAHSASMPREYTIEIEGKQTKVIAIQWTLRRLVQQGDRVKIKGTLRTKNGREFISLDEDGDILLRKEL